MISLWKMFVKHAYHFTQIERALTQLEAALQPEQIKVSIEDPSKALRIREGLENDNIVTRLKKLKSLVLEQIENISKESQQLGLERTGDRIRRIREYVQSASVEMCVDDTLMREVGILRQALEDDLTKYKIYIPSSREHALYYNQAKLFGAKVYDNFPSIRTDVVAAGDCYATDNFTACVFHLMRITERALRILARHLRVERQLKREIDYEDWKNIFDAVDKKLKALRNSKRGAKRQGEIDFYADAADRCQYFKELWRDNIMHSRSSYNDLEALNILNRVMTFMELLSRRIVERP